jgi:rhamnosyltransferase
MSGPPVSVIVRVRNQATRLRRCLELTRAQRPGGAGLELVVVDNGSRDETAEIARSFGAVVVDLPAEEFSFGGALNLGASRAGGELLIALSADAFLPDADWLARLVAAFEDPRVCCASGERWRPDGTPLRERVVLDSDSLDGPPDWGYSNGAGAFRATLWRERRFRSELPGSEDLEWSRYWLARGYRCVLDPALAVDHDHTHDPVRSVYRRARRETAGIAAFADPPSWPAWSVSDLARHWWSDLRFYDSPLRARLSHRRAARLLGEYAGRRR